MFTGIISDVGMVVYRDDGSLCIRTHYNGRALPLGTSIACDGCCLTVTMFESKPSGEATKFWAGVSNETLSKTTIGHWEKGRCVNLERSTTATSELAGHLVTGHIDGVALILERTRDGDSRRFTIEVPEHLARFIAPKGSVALDGISLTVNDVEGRHFGVNLVRHTLLHTTWMRKKPGDLVNIEVDLIARYVARLMEFRA